MEIWMVVLSLKKNVSCEIVDTQNRGSSH